MDIDRLEMSLRSINALRRAGVETVEDLLRLEWSDIKNISGAGERAAMEIIWSCIKLLSGRMTDTLKEVDGYRNGLKKKAETLDRILAILNQKA